MEAQKKLHAIALIIGIPCLIVSKTSFSAGYFQLHNLMSSAQKNIPSNLFLNDATLNLEYLEKGTGRIVNTQFANNGGMAGCGVTSTLMNYMYQNAGNNNLASNYIALNVYSQIMGFDPQAPFWGDPEGQVKGYLTQGANIAYPYTPYHRVIPSLYPAYLGLYNNGLNCGRWVEADFDQQSCNDMTTATGISKFCPSVGNLTYTAQKMQAYVFDSCEDNNGWCRDDAAHIDVDSGVINANNYLQWTFIKNPYYSNPAAPASLKDVWLAWFGQASQYWSYVAILNAENGISNVQYNIGDPTNPTWISSHVLAGDNNVTWSSTSNNGQLWQIEPVNALTDTAPSSNPLYQMRMFDYLGYPMKQGTIYQFNLNFSDGTLGNNAVQGYSLFYQGGAVVKSGVPANVSLLPVPSGNGTVTVNFNQLLPSAVSLDSTQTNYLRPVLISTDGYAWDATQCANNQCVFSNLPTTSTFYLFAHSINDVSNDLTLRKVNDVTVHSANINFTNNTNSTNYSLANSDINLSTLYSARVQIPLQFAASSNASVNGNLQALFVPDNTKNNLNNVTAQTQGCFLNTYLNTLSVKSKKSTLHAKKKLQTLYGNNSTCTVYYTVNNQTSFSNTTVPSAYFNVILPTNVGVPPVNYSLPTPYSNPVAVTGYNPSNTSLPTPQIMPVANYNVGAGTSRSIYLLIDPQSDTACLQNLTNVGVSLGNSTATLTSAGVPTEIQISQATNTLSAQVNLNSNANLSCQAMPAIVPSSNPLQPGIDVVEVLKLVTVPVPLPPKPATQGIAATSSGDAVCLGGSDTLLFSSNGSIGTSVAYTPSATPTNVGVNATLGTYTITDKPFNVTGGSCQLSNSPVVTLQSNTYVPVNLQYQFSSNPASSCVAVPQIMGTWQNGCNVQMSLTSAVPLTNVQLSWLAGQWNWANAQVWSGQGSLTIPTNSNASVIWTLPTWVTGQGSTVGMTINNDTTPSICSAFASNAIPVSCSGNS